jgi:hypothetical protein
LRRLIFNLGPLGGDGCCNSPIDGASGVFGRSLS